jgi:crotonobetainyl-CoA:carnitine CoA-transferase CaiB-like acyl-CoA transferase
MSGPLTGLTVVDVTSAAAGPFAAALLGQLGAEVIKIEPPTGDRIHVVLPTQQGRSTTYMAMNVNKRGMILNLKNPQEYAIALGFIDASDIFLENYRRGVAERLGLDYATLSARNPGLIYCTIAGWGERGPWATLANIDPYVQAAGGFASITGSPGSRAESMRYYGHLDLTTSCTAVQAILTALYARHKTGTGQYLQTSLLAANMALQATRIAEYFATGTNPPRLGHAVKNHVPHQAFATQTHWIAVAVHTAEEWHALCTALEVPQLIDDPRFIHNAARVEHRQELIPILQECFRHKPALWWVQLLGRWRVPCGLFMGYPALRHHQQVRANDLIVELDTPRGRLHVGGIPWRFSITPCTLQPPTEPGQYTQAYIQRAGVPLAAIPGATDETPKFVDTAAQISRPF